MSRRVALCLAASMSLLTGCASFSPDGGMGEVGSAVSRETGKDAVKITSAEDMQRARERVAALLAAPLSADAAVQDFGPIVGGKPSGIQRHAPEDAA